MAPNGQGQWDLAIVGASFGGAACALAARQAGLRVCVLERKRVPGIKLHTTGIIVKEAAEDTTLARIPPALVRRVDRVRLYAPNLRSVALQAPGYYFLTTDTPNVMRWLADELRHDGVELRLMQSFTGATRDGDGWRIDGLGRAHWLVGADGAKSRVAARTGLGRVRDFLYGVEYEFAGATLHEPDALHCFISKRYAPGYIGWATQNPTGVQFGLAFRRWDPLRVAARLGGRRGDCRAPAPRWPATGARRRRRRPALPRQARAALDFRPRADGLADQPDAGHRPAALGRGTGVLPPPRALIRATAAAAPLAPYGVSEGCDQPGKGGPQPVIPRNWQERRAGHGHPARDRPQATVRAGPARVPATRPSPSRP
ncbi:hypothetical protein BH23PSE2_BH23PSE2_09770 [soil metagenome]